MAGPIMNGIFHRQIEGDVALLALAQTRFREADLGAEFYPPTPDDLGEWVRFRPSKGPYTVHLPRSARLMERSAHDLVATFAARFAEQGAYGLIVHDQPEIANHFDQYIAVVRDLDRRLVRQGSGPLLFIEYAAGLETATFIEMCRALRECTRVSACIDVSHIGIRQCQRAYAVRYPGEDICRLKPDVGTLRQRVDDVQAATATALPVVLEAIAAIGAFSKPLHFHLHDGHPSSTFSAYGVSDHLSFFHEIPIPFRYRGSQTLPTLYGPLGLKRIIDTARQVLPDDRLSFTLEIHPQEGRLALGEDAALFRHWRDLGNAEKMNYWIEIILRNHRLLQEVCGK
jgi:hypothetical protein